MYLSPTSLFWQTGLDVFFPLWFSVKQVGFNYVWILRLGSELAGSFIIFVRNGIPLNSWFLPIRCCWILQFIWEKYSDISLGNYYITITVLGYVLMWGIQDVCQSWKTSIFVWQEWSLSLNAANEADMYHFVTMLRQAARMDIYEQAKLGKGCFFGGALGGMPKNP